MAFTHALYYPWIDIEKVENQEWLKTAILYWDKLSTIVPSYSSYESQDANFLHSEGILFPEFVDSYSSVVNEASENFLSYLYSEEADGILLPQNVKVYRIPTVKEAPNLASIRTAKMSEELVSELEKSGRVIREDDRLLLDRDSANYYMILLATSISKQKNLAPVTDDQNIEALLNRVRRGDAPNLPARQLGEGLIARIALESIGIAEETPFDDIIKFRHEFQDELGYFRTKIGELAEKIDPETPSVEALEQQAYDIYKNEIAPAVSTLKKALKISNIRNIATQLTSAIFMASVPFLPKDSPVNLITGAIAQIVAQGVNFALNKKQLLSERPYSYVLKVEEQLS